MPQFTVEQKNLTDLGGVSLSLPIIRIGSGKPALAIVASQHGGETSGLLVINRLLEMAEVARGSIVILPIANPLGLLFRTREEPLEKANLNRSYPGDPGKNLALRLAAAVVDAVKDAECVIDLHTFTGRQSGVLGVMHAGESAQKTDSLMRLLNPDAVWEIEPQSGEDRQFAGDLDSALSKLSIPCLGLELPRQQNITPDQIERVAGGIINLAAGLGITAETPEDGRKNIPVYRARMLYAPKSGIFTPSAEVYAHVASGDQIGTLRAFDDFQMLSLKTNLAGCVITIHYADAIRTGEKLASIGTLVRTL